MSRLLRDVALTVAAPFVLLSSAVTLLEVGLSIGDLISP